MDLSQQIEIYMDRPVDFNQEVILRADENNKPYIDVWNITDKEQPTLDELNNLDLTAYNAQQQKDQNNANIQAQLDKIDANSQTTRPFREYMIDIKNYGYNNKIQDAENQAIALRSQLIK